LGEKACAKETAASVGKFIPFVGQALTAGEVVYGGYKAWGKYQQCIGKLN